MYFQMGYMSCFGFFLSSMFTARASRTFDCVNVFRESVLAQFFLFLGAQCTKREGIARARCEEDAATMVNQLGWHSSGSLYRKSVSVVVVWVARAFKLSGV